MRSIRSLIFIGAIAAIVLVEAFVVLLAFGVVELDPEAKSVWDWLDLLIIPLSLVIVATVLQLVERRTDRRIAKERTKTDRQIAHERVQAETLQSYLDSMGTLINSGGLENNATIHAMKARTSVTMRNLSSELNIDLISFLQDSYLLGKGVKQPEDDEANSVQPMASLLQSSNLSRAKLELADLGGADLRGANLSGANLAGADLSGADLYKTNLSGANLNWAILNGTNLRRANLDGANLGGAVSWTPEQLSQDSYLVGATLPDGMKIKTAEEWLAFKREHGGGQES